MKSITCKILAQNINNLDIYMVVMPDSELIVWGRSPVKELKERSLQREKNISTQSVLNYYQNPKKNSSWKQRACRYETKKTIWHVIQCCMLFI